eukprot:scaffold8021_cov79-Skeletonema_marinoi.AAC.14
MKRQSQHLRPFGMLRDNKFLLLLHNISLVRLFFSGGILYLLIVGVLVNHLSLLPSLSLNNIHIRQHISIDNTLHELAAADNAHKEGASACLLVNDENPRIPEWIAYHYHTLPLRSLTVAVDPSSRSSPLDILQRWNDTGLMEMQLWNDDDYLHEIDSATGAKIKRIKVTPDVDGHRIRQNHFINKCMLDFKQRKKQWVLLIDVDEYISFNRIDDDNNQEPDFPVEKAPDGIPTLMDWTWDSSEGVIKGWIDDTLSSPTKVKTESLVSQMEIQPGGVVADSTGVSYHLRDDRAFRDLDALDQPPEPMPTLKYVVLTDSYELCGEIFNDVYNEHGDESWVCLTVDWEAPENEQKKTNIFHGGYVVEDLQQRKYFLEKELALWPKRLAVEDAKDARERLPRVDERKTILDVVKEESNRHGYETMGPCIMMPRLRYGSFEVQPEAATVVAAPGGIDPKDFVTLRYRWHGAKGVYAYGKTMIDVSQIPTEELQVEAENVHAPLSHYCPRQVWHYSPQYTTSLFRVNHYLDSFEAYTYRKDVRVELRQSVDRYNTLAKEGNHSMDTEGSHWLQEFVQDMGSENAKMLLAGVGSFPRLDWSLSKILWGK